jgi:NAD(P)-dependent dehydrogenase (short-subunit alcohol dehydrogenase family)
VKYAELHLRLPNYPSSWGRTARLAVEAWAARPNAFAGLLDCAAVGWCAAGPPVPRDSAAAPPRDGGALVFATSTADESGASGTSVYAGPKAAVRAFGRGLATEEVRAVISAAQGERDRLLRRASHRARLVG